MSGALSPVAVNCPGMSGATGRVSVVQRTGGDRKQGDDAEQRCAGLDLPSCSLRLGYLAQLWQIGVLLVFDALRAQLRCVHRLGLSLAGLCWRQRCRGGSRSSPQLHVTPNGDQWRLRKGSSSRTSCSTRHSPVLNEVLHSGAADGRLISLSVQRQLVPRIRKMPVESLTPPPRPLHPPGSGAPACGPA